MVGNWGFFEAVGSNRCLPHKTYAFELRNKSRIKLDASGLCIRMPPCLQFNRYRLRCRRRVRRPNVPNFA